MFDWIYIRCCRLYYLVILKYLKSEHHLSYISRKCPFGDLRKKAWMKMGNLVGKDTYVNHSITILSSPDIEHNVILGERVALSPNITFITFSSPNFSNLGKNVNTQKYIRKAPIRIGDDSWIGTGVTIQPGVTIGKNCIIGSMSNVTSDVPDHSMGYGNPFRVIKHLDV